MITLTKLRNSLRLRRKPAAAITVPFASPDAPTVELDTPPRIELPAISKRMVSCTGQRKRALFYEDSYSRF